MKKVKLKETRVFGISCERDSHPMDDKTFMDIAEEEGNVWSLHGFQNFLNCEGSQEIQSSATRERFFSYLHFRFITMEIKFESKTKELI